MKLPAWHTSSRFASRQRASPLSHELPTEGLQLGSESATAALRVSRMIRSHKARLSLAPGATGLGDFMTSSKVSKLYDMIHPEANDTLTVRSVFIIDNNKKIRATLTYPASTGRNFTEILRVIDSLQLTDNFKVATPADWKDGDDCVIVPSITDPAELKQRFPKGHQELRPYLRMTPQPNK